MKHKVFNKMILNLLSFFILSLFVKAEVGAQDLKTVRGRVTDISNNEPLPGVNVVIQNTTKGTITNPDGEYTISAQEGDVLVFSYIGYVNEEIPYTGQSTIDIQLVPDITTLDEIVVVGYGTQRKEDLTGAIARVDLGNADERPNTDVLQALRGNTSGVYVTTGSRAGESGNIVIRGVTTFFGSSDPLIILDGVPYQGQMSDLNMNDIESIDVLKDASSAAIYGSRATNGVILVTTKRGESEKPTISFNSYYGIHQYGKKLNVCGPERYFEKKQDYLSLILRMDVPDSIVLSTRFEPFERENYQNGIVLDPYDAITNDDASIQNYDLSISGTSERSSYFMSTSYTNDKGLIKGDDFKRLTARVNLETEVTEWLKLGVNTSLTHSDRSGGAVDFDGALRLSPFSQLRDTTGALRLYPYGSYVENPLYTLNVDDLDKSDNRSIMAYSVLDLPFIKGLSYRINYSNNYLVDHRSYYYGRDTEIGQDLGGVGERVVSETNYWLLENILNYKTEIGRNHSLSFTAMYGAEQTDYTYNALTGSGFTTDGMSYNGLSSGNSTIPLTRAAEESLVSALGRINYKLLNRYLFTATIRRDGSSKFGKNNKFAYFPSVAVGWVLSQESFIKNIKAVDFLKLRFSFGKNGYNGIPPYRTQPKMYTRRYEYANGNDQAAIFSSMWNQENYPSELQNENLRWESTLASNIGIDFALFNNRFSGTIEYYKGRTYDILMNRPVPIVSGFNTSFQNIGETENSGIEITLNTVNIKLSDFEWKSTLTYFNNNNVVTSLLPNEDLLTPDNPRTEYALQVGYPVFAYYDYVKDGIVQEDEIYMDGGPLWAPGSYRLEDLTGDSAVTVDDRQYIGTTQPDFMAGIQNTITYKNISLSFLVNIVIGGIIRNERINFYQDANIGVLPDRTNTLDMDWWMPDNPDAKYPRLTYTNPFNVGEYDSRSFGRLQDVTLSYRLPLKWTNSLKMSNAKIYLSGKNLITIDDDFHDWDPENQNVSVWANTNRVEQDGRGDVPWLPDQAQQVHGGRSGFPLPRTIVMGINVSF
ncbi:MAG: SusC/RagA family TonB-linked outer membrane protein [Bacteroidota bacterium]